VPAAEILRAFAGFGSCVYPGGLLERRVKELVIITASQTNECQFCTTRTATWSGSPTSVDEPLHLIDEPASLAPRERVACEYTRAAMADSNHVPDALATKLKERFSDPELVELSFLIGYINMLNLFNNLLACATTATTGSWHLLVEREGWSGRRGSNPRTCSLEGAQRARL
jgi:alkylhydroperoxidase family enzyme